MLQTDTELCTPQLLNATLQNLPRFSLSYFFNLKEKLYISSLLQRVSFIESRCQTVQLPLAKFELLSSDFVPSLISPQPKLVLKSAERGREQKQILISVLLMKGSGVNSKCLWKEAIAHQCKVMKSLFKDSIISNEFKQHCKWVVKRRKCLRPFDNS